MWQAYETWRSADPAERPEASLVDGFLAGAVVALQDQPEDYWLGSIIDPATCGDDKGYQDALDQLRHRMEEVRTQLAESPSPYAPILTVTDGGEFDVTAWATGFLEAIGSDLEMWAYHLNKSEAGLLGLVSSRAIGPVGAAGRTRIAQHENSNELEELSSQLWEFIPTLVETLYRKKVQLAIADES
jgi:yecA family protein